jgi:hypothetical protein
MVTLCELLDVRHRVPPAFCCCACQQHHMQMKHIPSANGPTQTVCTQHGRPCGHELRGRSWRLCRTSGGSAFGECAARGDSSVLGNWCALARVRASEGQQTADSRRAQPASHGAHETEGLRLRPPRKLLRLKLSLRRHSRNHLGMEETCCLRPASSSATGSSGSSPSLPPASCTFPTARPLLLRLVLYTLELIMSLETRLNTSLPHPSHPTSSTSSSRAVGDEGWASRASSALTLASRSEGSRICAHVSCANAP